MAAWNAAELERFESYDSDAPAGSPDHSAAALHAMMDEAGWRGPNRIGMDSESSSEDYSDAEGLWHFTNMTITDSESPSESGIGGVDGTDNEMAASVAQDGDIGASGEAMSVGGAPVEGGVGMDLPARGSLVQDSIPQLGSFGDVGLQDANREDVYWQEADEEDYDADDSDGGNDDMDEERPR